MQVSSIMQLRRPDPLFFFFVFFDPLFFLFLCFVFVLCFCLFLLCFKAGLKGHPLALIASLLRVNKFQA